MHLIMYSSTSLSIHISNDFVYHQFRKKKIFCPLSHLENPTYNNFFKLMPPSRELLTSPSVSGEEYKLTSTMKTIRKHDSYKEVGINSFQDGDRCCCACGGQVSMKRKQFETKDFETKDENFFGGNAKVSSVSGCCLQASSTLNSRFLPFPIVNDFCFLDTFTFDPLTSCHLPTKLYSLDTSVANSIVFEAGNSAAIQAANPAVLQAANLAALQTANSAAIRSTVTADRNDNNYDSNTASADTCCKENSISVEKIQRNINSIN